MDIAAARKLPLLARAARTFKLRCVIDAKEDIARAGVLDGDAYSASLRALLAGEMDKGKLLRAMEARGNPLTLDALLQAGRDEGLDELSTVAKAMQLAVEGHLACTYQEDDTISFTHLTSDPDTVKPLYVPVKAIEDGKSCSGCAMCQATCPVGCIEVDDGKVSINMDTCVRCGLCYEACPRSFLPKPVLDWATGGRLASKEEVKTGFFIEAWSARTLDPAIDAVKQDGGIVSSLLAHAFSAGKIEAALGSAMDAGIPWKPAAVVMRGKDDVVKAAGTKYVNTPTLKLLRQVAGKPVAVVGTPCMMQALKKADIYPAGTLGLDNVKYRIGIFCMESFTHAGIKQLAEKILEVSLASIRKMDINEGQFFVYMDNGEKKSVSMKEITRLARMGCHGCYDLTSEMADISVGSIGSPAGWNTVLVRTPAGKELFDEAVASGLVERKPIEDVQPGLPLLKKLALVKKRNYEKTEGKRAADGAFHPWYFMRLPPPPPPKKETI